MQRQFISVLAICLRLTKRPNFIPGCHVLVWSSARSQLCPAGERGSPSWFRHHHPMHTPLIPVREIIHFWEMALWEVVPVWEQCSPPAMLTPAAPLETQEIKEKLDCQHDLMTFNNAFFRLEIDQPLNPLSSSHVNTAEVLAEGHQIIPLWLPLCTCAHGGKMCITAKN